MLMLAAMAMLELPMGPMCKVYATVLVVVLWALNYWILVPDMMELGNLWYARLGARR